MSGTPTACSALEQQDESELEQQLLSVGITYNSEGRAVYAGHPEIEVPFGEFVEVLHYFRTPLFPFPGRQRHAWDRPPAPTRPPGLPSPTAANSQLFTIFSDEFQAWPAEFQEFDVRYSAVLQAAPTFTIQSAGGPIRRPSPPTPRPAVVASETTGRTSRGVHVTLGSYFLASGLRESVIHMPPRAPRTAAETATGRSGPEPLLPIYEGNEGTAVIPGSNLRASALSFVPQQVAVQAAVPTSAILAAVLSSAGTPQQQLTAQDTASLAVLEPAIPVTGPINPDLRMVLLRGIPVWITLADMSASVSSALYGAIFSISFKFEKNQRVAQVIFRDAFMIDTHKSATPGAQGYYIALRAAADIRWEDRDNSLWPFPRLWLVDIRLVEFPANDLIRAMRPIREPRSTEPGSSRPQNPILAFSRRISLVGQQRLFQTFREEDIMGVIHGEGTISKSSVERICVYNSGNATIVFADVETAVEAMRLFEAYNSKATKYKKVVATHSKCPCETKIEYTVDAVYTHYLDKFPRKK